VDNHILEKLVTKNMPIPKPIEFDVCNNSKSVYSLLTWMDGEDAESVIPSFNERTKPLARRPLIV
jgi:aminoglycoside phosphotransferase (APT) family kinase protein